VSYKLRNNSIALGILLVLILAVARTSGRSTFRRLPGEEIQKIDEAAEHAEPGQSVQRSECRSDRHTRTMGEPGKAYRRSTSYCPERTSAISSTER
jgi:hypothetical protein